MKVGIDASGMLVSEKTGIEHYTTALILSLCEVLAENADIEITLYFHIGNPYVDSSLLDSYLPELADIRRRIYRPRWGYRLALPTMAMLDRLDLLHVPSPVALRFATCPVLMTFHDASWLHLPAEGKRIEGLIGRSPIEQMVQSAIALVAVSRSTKQDLVNVYGVDPERVQVIYHGVDGKYQPQQGAAQVVRRKYGLDRYILNVSTLQYRKNQTRLIEAFDRLRQQYLVPHTLVIVGHKGWGWEQVKAAALKLDGQVRLLDYVPEKDLPGLYAAADLFVYPSLYEGFGMPVLEAMACGTAVATSDCSSLPEVAGDAAIYFDPYDVEQIATAMHHVLANPLLRNEMQTKGLERVKGFTWKNAAHQTLDVYQRLLTGSHSECKHSNA